jgi:hypothetical protein
VEQRRDKQSEGVLFGAVVKQKGFSFRIQRIRAVHPANNCAVILKDAQFNSQPVPSLNRPFRFLQNLMQTLSSFFLQIPDEILQAPISLLAFVGILNLSSQFV